VITKVLTNHITFYQKELLHLRVARIKFHQINQVKVIVNLIIIKSQKLQNIKQKSKKDQNLLSSRAHIVLNKLSKLMKCMILD
jgi:hypothetical protein